MKLQDIFSKGVFIVFNLVMIIYLIRGFFYPVESNFWLVQWGLPIMIMEFFSIFGVFSVLSLKKKREIKTFFGLLAVILFAILIGFRFNNYMVILFFILTLLSKFFITTTDHYEKETKIYASIAIAFLLSIFLAVIFSKAGYFFPAQQELLRNTMIERGILEGDFVENPAFLLAWGVCYYILLTIFQTFKIIRFKKDNPQTKPKHKKQQHKIK